jgi:hypothetical protein
MNEESDSKTTLLGAALHYNPELKKEVEEWVREIMRTEFRAYSASSYEFERTHINNFGTFKRLVREVLKQDLESLKSHGI